MIIGDKAPGFSLLNDIADRVSLSSLLGNNIILYFYPRDDTPGCTQEAQDFKAITHELKSLSTIIIGISKDNINSHRNFKKKYDLPFHLLSDENAKTLKEYQVWVEKSMFGKKYMGIERSTFLLDKKGLIVQIWRKVKITNHAMLVLEAVKKLCTK